MSACGIGRCAVCILVKQILSHQSVLRKRVAGEQRLDPVLFNGTFQIRAFRVSTQICSQTLVPPLSMVLLGCYDVAFLADAPACGCPSADFANSVARATFFQSGTVLSFGAFGPEWSTRPDRESHAEGLPLWPPEEP